MNTQYKVKNAECYIRCRRPRARPVPHGSIELSCTCTYHILTAQQEPYRITIFFFFLLPNLSSGEKSHIAINLAIRLATVQNWMLVALEKASLLTPLRKFGSSCWWSALPPSYNRFIVWNGGKWSHDINQVLWLVVCRSAQKQMSDDSTQDGCANKEHQTNYSQSGGANSHSDNEIWY